MAKSKQLRKSEEEIAFLQATTEDLIDHGAWLSTQVAEVCQEATLVRGKLVETRRDVEVSREVAKAMEDSIWETKDAVQATEDVVWAAEDPVANNAQDISLQASFKVLRQALV